jgi:hypothetical protein
MHGSTAREGLRKHAITFFFLAALITDMFLHLMVFSFGPFPLYKDSRGYWYLAGAIAGGDVSLTHTAGVVANYAYRTPGYPVFLFFFQSLFGRYAMAAAVFTQHSLQIIISGIIIFVIWRTTRSKSACLAGYIIWLFFWARMSFANMLVSETLFSLMLTLLLAMIIELVRKPDRWPAFAVGIVTGLAMIIRPIGQIALFSSLLGLTVAPKEGWTALGKKLVPFALIVLGTGIVVGPWVLRNEALYNDLFVSKFVGRSLWNSCFSESGADLRFSKDGVVGKSVDEIVSKGGNKRSMWVVAGSLRERGFSEIESDDLMKRYCINAIEKEPLRFFRSVVRRYAQIWYTTGTVLVTKDSEWLQGEMLDQVGWHWEKLADMYRALIRKVYVKKAILYALIALMTHLSILFMVIDKRIRPIGIVIGSFLISVTLVSVVVEIPLYRFRMVLEPVIVIALVLGSQSFLSFFRQISTPHPCQKE